MKNNLKELLEKSQFTLSESIKIYIPSTVDVNSEIDNKIFVTNTETKLSKIFGGTTTINGVGCWVSEKVGLVRESVKIVNSFTSLEGLDKHISEVIEICENLKSDMKQEGISLEVQGKFYVI